MNILNLLSENQELIGQLSKQFGLTEQQTKASVEPLTQNVAAAIKSNTQNQQGLDSFLQAISGGNHAKYVENPSTLEQQETANEGNNILGHLFGSKDVSRNVAQKASEQSGVSSDILKKMLPLIASAVMGKASQQASNQGMMGNISNLLGGNNDAAGQSQLSGLTALFDADGDGSMVDDALSLATKMFGTK